MAAEPPHPQGGGPDHPDAADTSHQPDADDSDQQPADSGQQPAERSRSLTGELVELLPAVVLHGVDDTTTDDLRPMFGLGCVRQLARDDGDDSDDGLTAAARAVIGQAVDALGPGPYGRAARLLFGMTEESRHQPRPVRRDLAADQVGVMAQWFSRSHERQILQSVATEVYSLERRSRPAATSADTATAVVSVPDGQHPADTSTAITPTDAAPTDSHDGQGQDDGKGQGQARRSRVARVLRWVRPQIPDEQALTVLMAGPSSAHALSASRPKQLLHDLEQLRDQRARRQWYGVYGSFAFERGSGAE